MTQPDFENRMTELKENYEESKRKVAIEYANKLYDVETDIMAVTHARRISSIEGHKDREKLYAARLESLRQDKHRLSVELGAINRHKKEVYLREREAIQEELNCWLIDRQHRGVISRNKFDEAVRTVHGFIEQGNKDGIRVFWDENTIISIQFEQRSSASPIEDVEYQEIAAPQEGGEA